MRELPRFVVVALVCIRKSDSLLLVKQRYDEQYWSLPGGVVEPGESLDQAAIREVKEETGLDIGLKRVVGLYGKKPESGPALLGLPLAAGVRRLCELCSRASCARDAGLSGPAFSLEAPLGRIRCAVSARALPPEAAPTSWGPACGGELHSKPLEGALAVTFEGEVWGGSLRPDGEIVACDYFPFDRLPKPIRGHLRQRIADLAQDTPYAVLRTQ